MDNLIRFLKYMPRLFFGGVFSIELFYIFAGSNTYKFIYAELTKLQINNDILSSTIIVLLIIAICSFGILLLDSLISLAETVYKFFITKLRFMKKILMGSKHMAFSLPLVDLINYIHINNKELIQEYAITKNKCYPCNFQNVKVDELTNMYAKFIKENLNRSTLFDFTYFSHFTQEQQKLDDYKAKIYDSYYLLICMISFMILLYIYSITSLVVMVVTIIGSLIFTLPAIKKSKIYYATSLIFYCYEAFILVEQGSIEDRDAI